MRYIIKGIEPEFLKLKIPPNTPEEAKAKWKSFNKRQLKELLLKEQFHLCGYTEIYPENHGVGKHIEHIAPKSKYPELTFEYTNLVISSLVTEDYPDKKGEFFAGHYKGNKYNEHLFVSCLDYDCSRFFSYTSDGRVNASIKLSNEDKEKASYTIETLNLNSEILKNMRKKWFDELDEIIDGCDNNKEMLKKECSYLLTPKDNKLEEFYSVTKQRFKILNIEL